MGPGKYEEFVLCWEESALFMVWDENGNIIGPLSQFAMPQVDGTYDQKPYWMAQSGPETLLVQQRWSNGHVSNEQGRTMLQKGFVLSGSQPSLPKVRYDPG